MLTVYNLMFTRLADYECSENIKLYQHHAFCPKKVTLFRDINGMNINIGIRVLRKRHIIRIVGCSLLEEIRRREGEVVRRVIERISLKGRVGNFIGEAFSRQPKA